MTPAAVLFDCDGVIVDSEGPTFAMVQADFAAHGLPLTRHDLETNWIGTTAEALFLRARAEGASLPDGWVPDFYTRLNARLAQGVPLIPGILTVLDKLDHAKIPYAVCSNGTLAKMRITLGQHGLLPRLNGHWYSGQAQGHPKPAPDVYLHAACALNIAPETAVVVEDSPTGARAARAAGIRCLGYAPSGHNPALQAEAATLFQRMTDLPRLLGL